jgi:uncharacterized membrane protein YphA (DoxX/SURF4 family)
MKTAATIARYLLGVGFVVFGVNAFFQFMPPPELTEQGGQFMGLMFESGYFYWVAVLKIAGGLMLVLGRFVPLGLTLLGPVLVNILLFHLSFDLAGIGMGAFFTVLWFIVFLDRKASFRALWAAGP